MKRQKADRGVARQALLIPEVVDLDPAAAERVAARAGELAALGLVLEAFGEGAVVVREVPALLGETNVPGLIHGPAAGQRRIRASASSAQAFSFELFWTYPLVTAQSTWTPPTGRGRL